jgi:hypothetical protein
MDFENKHLAEAIESVNPGDSKNSDTKTRKPSGRLALI